MSRLTRRAAVVAAVAIAVSSGTSTASAATPQASKADLRPPVVTDVTLITGDVVTVTRRPGGAVSAVLRPDADGTIPQAAINQVGDHLYVVPEKAFGLLANRSLSTDLFDVTALIADGYDDSSTSALPVLVDYGRGPTAAAEARAASFAAADRTVTVPAIGIAAFDADKSDATSFWNDLTTGGGAASGPQGLSDGAQTVSLDGQVAATLEDSVPQIGAPQAWDAGFDGKGVTVAVLDTGYDPTHPDLQDVVADSQNFTQDDSVVDGNGHGTHVASTIAGSGAASDGERRGVAPGASLLVGKVLSNEGIGQDSEVLAGMQWAVNQGADVVSMSLGGDVDDGTSVLAQAVNQLSATSDTLFVIAAGNNGGAGPSSVTAPGTADAALTVGAVDVNDVMASFSGRGPRAGSFALKPEVVAPGVDVTAARAAGTSLGPVVDDYYTTISGTSMATPHVAGMAAILKERHPRWDGERLKSVIANSTVAVPDASGFDAGTGRVDVPAALDAGVFAPASLSLGAIRWPYDNLHPAPTNLTYTNPGSTDVTLDVSVAAQDGSPLPGGAITLSAPQVVVPAHGTASVPVLVDPTTGDPGSYSAVVTAIPEGGVHTVRTVVGYQLEPERYDLTVVVRPRDGQVHTSHQLGLLGYDTYTYDSRTFDAASGEARWTIRVAPGQYSVGAISFGVAADGASEGVVSYNPSFGVHGDTTIVLDENRTAQFDYAVSKPVHNDGAILDISWDGPSGHTGFMFYGATDRVFAQPSDPSDGGAANVAANWLLSQPAAELTVKHGPRLALSVVNAGRIGSSAAPTGRDLRLVDAGSTSNLRVQGVSRSIAVVEAGCGALDDTVARLAARGARAVVTYPTVGAVCSPSLSSASDVPVLEASSLDASELVQARPALGRLWSHPVPEYMYDLVRYWAKDVPDGGTVRGTGSHVTAVREHYDSLGTSEGMQVATENIGWIPARNGVANLGLVHPVPFPSTVTHYMSTGARWERTVAIQDVELGGEYARLWAPPAAFEGGTTVSDTWFGGPIGSRVSPLLSWDTGMPPPIRLGDEMFFTLLGAFTDSAGHIGQSDQFSPEYSGALYADGEQVLDSYASVFLNTAVPAGNHRYRLVTDFQRTNAFWGRSSRIHSTWRFDSDTPHDGDDVLPLLSAQATTPLSNTGTAASGEAPVTVSFAMPHGVEASPMASARLSVSWNGGATWQRVALETQSDDTFTGVLRNRANSEATLRLVGLDEAGHSVRQVITDAYRVKG